MGKHRPVDPAHTLLKVKLDERRMHLLLDLGRIPVLFNLFHELHPPMSHQADNRVIMTFLYLLSLLMPYPSPI
jgi:hypothetical protein